MSINTFHAYQYLLLN